MKFDSITGSRVNAMQLGKQCVRGKSRAPSGLTENPTVNSPALCGRHAPCEPSTSGRQQQPRLQWSSPNPKTCHGAWSPQRARLCPPTPALVLLIDDPQTASPAEEQRQAKLLMAGITHCSSWRGLQRLLTRYATVLNHRHACAALSRLTVVLPRARQPQQDASSTELQGFYEELMLFLSLNLQHLSARELSNALGAIAQLQMQPSQSLLARMADAVQQQLPRHSGQDCASTAWALARLRHYPSASWLTAFLEQCRTSLPDMDSQALSNLLWALAGWAHRPPQPFLEAAAGCVSSRLPEFSSQGLSNVLWAFAKLHYKPSPAWIEAYWDAVSSHIAGSSMAAAELSSVIFAAGKLGCSLPLEPSLQLLVSYLGGRVHELDFPGASCALWGFSRLRFRPLALMDAWFAHTQSSMDSWSRSRGPGSGTAPAGHGEAQGRPLGSLDGKSLSNALYALQQLEAASGATGTVPSAWLQSAVVVCAALLDEMDARSVAVSGLCLAKLGAAVDDAWLTAYAAAAQRALDSMNSAEVANVLCALSRFRHVPSEEFMCLLLAHLQEEMIGFKAKELANSCLALVHLGKDLAAAEPSCQWSRSARKTWAALHKEVKRRWQLLPSSSADAKTVGIMRHALKLAGQDASWLPYL